MCRSSKGFHPLSFFDKMNVCIFYLSMHATSLIHLTLPELMQEDEVDRAKKNLWTVNKPAGKEHFTLK